MNHRIRARFVCPPRNPEHRAQSRFVVLAARHTLGNAHGPFESGTDMLKRNVCQVARGYEPPMRQRLSKPRREELVNA